MAACTPDCRKPTGLRMEHCKGCHRSFAGHALANQHSRASGEYVLAKPTSKSPASTMEHFPTDADIPKGWSKVGGLNTVFRCLSTEELLKLGMHEEKGVWHGAPTGNAWWSKGEDDEGPAMADEEEPEDQWDEQAVS